MRSTHRLPPAAPGAASASRAAHALAALQLLVRERAVARFVAHVLAPPAQAVALDLLVHLQRHRAEQLGLRHAHGLDHPLILRLVGLEHKVVGHLHVRADVDKLIVVEPELLQLHHLLEEARHALHAVVLERQQREPRQPSRSIKADEHIARALVADERVRGGGGA